MQEKLLINDLKAPLFIVKSAPYGHRSADDKLIGVADLVKGSSPYDPIIVEKVNGETRFIYLNRSIEENPEIIALLVVLACVKKNEDQLK